MVGISALPKHRFGQKSELRGFDSRTTKYFVCPYQILCRFSAVNVKKNVNLSKLRFSHISFVFVIKILGKKKDV